MPRNAVTISTRPIEFKSSRTFTVTKENLTIMSKKIGSLLRDSGATKKSDACLCAELNTHLKIADLLVQGGEDRKNFGNCKCSNPPSMGFCVEGMCVMANFNFSKFEGSLI